MAFLAPLALFALLTLPLIVLLHLIRQQRTRQRIPSLQLWQDLQTPTLQRSPRHLPITWLLLLHVLVAALLATALGQPLLHLLQSEATHTVVLVDTSSSMAATDGQPDRLADAKRTAQELVQTTDRNDSVALIELSAEPRLRAQGQGTNQAALLHQLDQLQPGGSDGDLQRALALAQATARPDAATRILVLTDRSLQTSGTYTIAGQVEWRTFGNHADNVAVVAFAARPVRNGGQQLYARVANLGTQPAARTLALELDGEQVEAVPINLAPGEHVEWSWPLPAGATRATATLSGTDPQPLDDRAFVVLQNPTRTQIQLVGDTTTALERAVRAQRNADVSTVPTSAYDPHSSADLVVFAGFVPQTLPDAPVLLVAPPAEQSLLDITGQHTDVQANIVDDGRFSRIDWRSLTLQRVQAVDVPDWTQVAVAADDVPLVLTGQLDDRPVVVWLFDPDVNNLANRIQFPLLTAASLQALRPALGELALGALAPQELRHTDGTRIAAGQRMSRPGFYEAESFGLLAVNALDPDEATLQARPQPHFELLPQPRVAAEPAGRELWRPLVIAGLATLAVEWIYTHRNRLGWKRRQRKTLPTL